jgi:hypothetical protein
MAFGSTRVMITCAHGGQAVGTAAALCQELSQELSQNQALKVSPKDLLESDKMKTLQNRLNRFGHGIPNMPLDTSKNLISQAQILASSELSLKNIPDDGQWLALNQAAAQLLPFSAGNASKITVQVKAAAQTQLRCELRVSEKPYNYTPDVSLKALDFSLSAGEQSIELDFSDVETTQQYAFVIFHSNADVEIKTSGSRVTGLLSVFNKVHKAVSNHGKQEMDPVFGIDSFEFWTPERRPKGHNIAMSIEPELNSYSVDNLRNGYMRPWLQTNAWVAEPKDPTPSITLKWSEKKHISGLSLYFDTDADHALETVWMHHCDKIMPFCVQDYAIKTKSGELLFSKTQNYQTVNKVEFDEPLFTDEIIIELTHPSAHTPAALFEIDVF